jgi:hypothetical protein
MINVIDLVDKVDIVGKGVEETVVRFSVSEKSQKFVEGNGVRVRSWFPSREFGGGQWRGSSGMVVRKARIDRWHSEKKRKILRQ